MIGKKTMAIDIAQATEALWRRRQEGVFYPPEWEDKLTIDEASRIQLAILDRRVADGERQAGWKVGATSKAIQEQFRVTEPLFGYLVDSAPYESGANIPFPSLIAPGFETEICMTLGADFVGPGVTPAQARSAVASVRPAFEIIETRGDFTRQLALAVVDNIQQKAVVLGGEVSMSADLDLRAARATIAINGEAVAEGAGDAVLGDPLNSLTWLANKLASYGRGLRAGDIVMTGSLVRQFPIAKGDRIAARFDPLGVVEASFE